MLSSVILMQEIAEIEAGRNADIYEETDTSLVSIGAGTAGEADAWGLVDDDGDGIILETVKGEGYSGLNLQVP